MDTICGFNIQRLDGTYAAWTVPITFHEEPNIEQIPYITEEVTKLTCEHVVLDMYAMCRKDFSFIYKSDDITDEDISYIFDVSSFYDK